MLSAIWPPTLWSFRRPAAWWLGFCLAGLFLSFLFALEHVSQATATTIAFIGPLALAVIGSRRRVELVWVSFAAFGVLLMSRGEIVGEPAGIALALLAAGFWALYIRALARLGQHENPYHGLAMANVVATLITVSLLVVTGSETSLSDVGSVAWEVIAFALLAGLVPLFAEYEALRRIPRHTFGVFMSLDPGFAALW